MPKLYVWDSNASSPVKRLYVNNSGNWANVKYGYVNDNGVWKQFYPESTSAIIYSVAGT